MSSPLLIIQYRRELLHLFFDFLARHIFRHSQISKDSAIPASSIQEKAIHTGAFTIINICIFRKNHPGNRCDMILTIDNTLNKVKINKLHLLIKIGILTLIDIRDFNKIRPGNRHKGWVTAPPSMVRKNFLELFPDIRTEINHITVALI